MSLADRILYVDDDAIIIDKPAGLPVDRLKSGGDSVVARVSELRCGKDQDPVPVYRLEQDASGCLLLARNPEGRAKIQQALENEAVVKYYLAVVDTEVEGDDGTIEIPLAKLSSPEQGFRMIVADRGEHAITEWVRLKVRDGRTLVRFEPKTSRTHQIRVHAREAFGAGIVGDPVYGCGEGPMLLHASRLSVALSPWSTGFSYHADAPLPDHFGPWRIDPDEVERDRQALKETFTYRDIDRDVDMGLQNLDRPVFDESNYGGYGPYWKFEPFVVDCYFEKGALEPLVKKYSSYQYPVGSSLDRILDALVAAGRADLMAKLWIAVTRRSRAAFYAERPGQFFGDQEWAGRAKSNALEAYDDAIRWMMRVDATEVAARMERERDALREGRMPELPPDPPDGRPAVLGDRLGLTFGSARIAGPAQCAGTAASELPGTGDQALRDAIREVHEAALSLERLGTRLRGARWLFRRRFHGISYLADPAGRSCLAGTRDQGTGGRGCARAARP